MINQWGSKHLLLEQIKKKFNRHPEAFWKYNIMPADIIGKIVATSVSRSVLRSASDSEESTKLVQSLGSNGPICNLN